VLNLLPLDLWSFLSPESLSKKRYADLISKYGKQKKEYNSVPRNQPKSEDA
jgi:hypothetical protein